MKKKLLSILLCLVMVVGLLPTAVLATDEVAINETNFPDKNFRDYVLTKFDKNNDSKLSSEEIAAVTKIEANNKGIKSLDGVGFFTALETLTCWGNELTGLDLSKNTALKELQCSNSKLQSLDLSQNTNLTYLYCGRNPLTTLDLSKNAKLEVLNCSGFGNKHMELTELDLSQNTALKSLDCSLNELKELYVSGCTALVKLDCKGNQLDALDVSKNENLTELLCSSNQLEALDVSKNTKLKELYCRDNFLAELDVSKNLELKSISYGKNGLTSLDLDKNEKITDVNSDNQQFYNKGTLPAGGTFDMKTLPGFDPKRAIDWQGGTMDETTGILTVDADAEAVTYKYKTKSDSTDAKYLMPCKMEVRGGTTPPLTGISVKTAPTKVTYNEGESFDATGMVIEATYSDSSTADVTGYTYAPTAALTTSDTTITISYTEGGVTKTCTQAITVNAAPKTLSSIAVTTAPTKTTYTAGENFDPTGMVVTATYSDSSTAAVTGYTVTDGTALTAGKTSVTISYTEGGVTETTTQAIAVNAPEFTITFDGNGGTPSVSDMTTTGQKLATLPTATRSGSYSFDGWYTAASGGTKVTTSYQFTADTTVYAHWTYTGGSSSGGGVSTYAITVDSAKNGDVTVSPRNASKGTTVTLTVEPDKGYTLETITVTDKNGDEIELTNKGDGKYTFKMPAGKVYVEVTFMEDNSMLNFFVDVPADAYYYDAVLWAAKNGITGGVDAAHFAPNATCTRAQVVTFLWRAAGSPAPKSSMIPFTDVPAGSYYEQAVLWAVENGITDGTSATTFSPDAVCSRGQIVTFLWRANGSPAVSGNSAFTDVASDAYYAAAVTWAEKNDITGGIGGGLFGSNNNCTRAQIVTFIYRSVK